jgi:hypothetical protein
MGAASSDKDLFTLKQGELLSKRQSHEARSRRPSRSDENAPAATASTGTTKKKKESLGQPHNTKVQGIRARTEDTPSPATLPGTTTAHRSLQTGQHSLGTTDPRRHLQGGFDAVTPPPSNPMDFELSPGTEVGWGGRASAVPPGR